MATDGVDESFETEAENPPDYRKTLRTKVQMKNQINTLTDRLNNMDGLRVEDIKKNDMTTCASPNCKTKTTDSSGYCSACIEALGPYLNKDLLRCSNCMAKEHCPKGNNKYGVCLIELKIDDEAIKSKEEIEEKMIEVLKRERKVIERFHNVLNNLDMNNAEQRELFTQIAKEVKAWQKNLFAHYDSFAKFEGWTAASKAEAEVFKTRAKLLSKIFGKEVKRNQYKHNNPQVEEHELPQKVMKVPVPRESRAYAEIGIEEDGYDGSDLDDDIDSIEEMEEKIRREDTTVGEDLLALEKHIDEYEKLQKERGEFDMEDLDLEEALGIEEEIDEEEGD
jgi:hypothetical protein